MGSTLNFVWKQSTGKFKEGYARLRLYLFGNVNEHLERYCFGTRVQKCYFEGRHVCHIGGSTVPVHCEVPAHKELPSDSEGEPCCARCCDIWNGVEHKCVDCQNGNVELPYHGKNGKICRKCYRSRKSKSLTCVHCQATTSGANRWVFANDPSLTTCNKCNNRIRRRNNKL